MHMEIDMADNYFSVPREHRLTPEVEERIRQAVDLASHRHWDGVRLVPYPRRAEDLQLDFVALVPIAPLSRGSI